MLLFQEADHYEVDQDLYSQSKRSKLEDPLTGYLALPAFRPWSPGKGAPYPPFPLSLAAPPPTPSQYKGRKLEVYAPDSLKERSRERYSSPERSRERYSSPERSRERYSSPERSRERYSSPERSRERYSSPERVKEISPVPIPPKKKYLEKGKG